MQPDWTGASIRDALAKALDAAEAYVLEAPAATIGLLAVDASGHPIDARSIDDEGTVLRKATAEPEVVPSIPDAALDWRSPTQAKS